MYTWKNILHSKQWLQPNIIISSSCNTSPIPPSCHGGDNDDNKLQYRAKFSPSLGHGLGHITNGRPWSPNFCSSSRTVRPNHNFAFFLKSICKVGGARAVCQLGCTISVSASVRHPLRVFFSWSAYLLVCFVQDLSTMIQYFSFTTNQHESSLSSQKPTSERARFWHACGMPWRPRAPKK